MALAGYSNALITGASAGLGQEFARALAARGVNLVLVARRRDRLEALASELQSNGVKVVVEPCDLADPSDRRRLAALFPRHQVDLLINNAGYGKIGAFSETSVEDAMGQVELNIAALTELSHHAVNHFQKARHGAIINIASTAAFVPIPYFSVYAATKSYVRDFSESLAHEVEEKGIRVATVFPGPTETEFFDRAAAPGTAQSQSFGPLGRMSAKDCVNIALAEFEQGRNRIVTGVANRAAVLASAVVPRRIAMVLAKKVARGDAQRNS